MRHISKFLLLLLVSAVTFQVYAYDYDTSVDGLYYKLNAEDKTATVVQGSSWNGMYSIDIPEIISFEGVDYTVTSLGDSAFYWSQSLSSVTIPETVKSIGKSAFHSCYMLTSLHIGQSVEIIEEAAFYNCNSLTSVTIPDSVKEIGGKAFFYCSMLNSIILGKSVTLIAPECFAGCFNVTSITCLAEVPPMSKGAFDDIHKPACTVTVPENSFEAYKVADDWKYFLNPDLDEHKYDFECDGLYYNIVSKDEMTCEVACNLDPTTEKTRYKFEELEIPETVTYDSMTYTVVGVESAAFQYAILKKITLPESITYLDHGFVGCQNLTSIDIPENVTSIVSAFYGCKNLKSIHLPEKIKNISYAFEMCSSLESINIPDGVTDLIGAFRGCASLQSIEFPDHITEIQRQTCGSCTSLTSVKLPANLKKIEKYAFFGCTNLPSIVLPAQLELIEEYAFQNDWALTEIISLNPVPPYTNGRWHPFQVFNGTLHVPAGCKSAYENEGLWQYFTIIDDAEEALSIGQISIDPSATKSYDILGRPVKENYSGFIIEDRKLKLRR